MLPGCGKENKRTFEEWEKIEEERIKASEKDAQYKGKVLEIISDKVEEPGSGFSTRTQVLKVLITSGPFSGEIIEVENSSDTSSAYSITVKKGQGIFFSPEFDNEGIISKAYVTRCV